MSLLATRIDTRSPDFERNAAAMASLVDDLRGHLARVRGGGGPVAVERHRKRGKLTARDRVDRLVDPGTAFLEISALAANGMYHDDAPAAGMIAGIGTVAGTDCMIVA
ncbi:MAG TPA: carboxyl transferase domain-containing protein, partial [Candidatus Elarobacter sp.]|nr:carboxyl transferase domain-containing protein [Candidatus Elarobacter sp.]